MKRGKAYLWYRVGAVALMCLFWLGRALSVQCAAQVSGEGTRAQIGAGTTIVHSKFGGQIFGFDIDQNGTEGVLSEDKILANGNVLAAIETFDQKTGKILKVVSATENQDNFLTLGIEGTSVGLVEQEIVTGIFVTDRVYDVLNPIASNKRLLVRGCRHWRVTTLLLESAGTRPPRPRQCFILRTMATIFPRLFSVPTWGRIRLNRL